MSHLLYIHCPSCGKELKASNELAGKRVRCTRRTCLTIFQVPPLPLAVARLDPDTPPPFTAPRKSESSTPARPARSRVPLILLGGAIGFLVLVAALGGFSYWWIGRPTRSEIVVFEDYVRTGNEIADLQKKIEDRPEPVAKLEALAQTHVGHLNAIQAIGPRRRAALQQRFGDQIAEMEKRRDARAPVMIRLVRNDDGPVRFVIERPEPINGPAADSIRPVAKNDPAPKPLTLTEIVGTWEAGSCTISIEPSGRGQAMIIVPLGDKIEYRYRSIDVDFSRGQPRFECAQVKETDPKYQFTFVSKPDVNTLIVQEANNLIAPNPLTFKRVVSAPKSPADPALLTARADPSLEGEWQLDSVFRVYTGREKDEIMVSGHKLIVRGTTAEVVGKSLNIKTGTPYTIDTDSSASPKKYRIVNPANADDFDAGIYWVENGVLLMRTEKLGTASSDPRFSGVNLTQTDAAGNDSTIPNGFLRPRGDRGKPVLRFIRPKSATVAEPKKVEPPVDVAALKQSVAGKWSGSGLTIEVTTEGKGNVVYVVQRGGTITGYLDQFDVQIKEGRPVFAFKFSERGVESTHELVVQPQSTATELMVHDVTGHFDPAKFTLKRTGGPPAPPKASGKGALSEQKRFDFDNATWVRFSADGKRLVALTYQLGLCEWDIATGRQVRSKPAVDGQQVLAITDDLTQALTLVRPDKNTLGSVHVWDIEAGRSLRSWVEPAGDWEAYSPQAVFSPDKKTVAMLYREPSIRKTAGGGLMIGGESKKAVFLWRAETGRPVALFPATSESGIAFSADGSLFLTNKDRQQVLTWNAETGKQGLVLDGAVGSPLDLGTTPDGKYVVASCLKDQKDTVTFWDAQTGKLTRTLEPSKYYARRAISPDSRMVLVASCGDLDRNIIPEVKLFNLATGAKIASKQAAPGEWYQEARFSPDGKMVAVTGRTKERGFVQLWKVDR